MTEAAYTSSSLSSHNLMEIDYFMPIIKGRKLRFSKVKEFLSGQKGLSDYRAHSLFTVIISRKFNYLYSLAMNGDGF